MKAKLVYAIALLALVFASANGASSKKASIHVEYIPQPDGNGDYELYLFASDRLLVCEDHPIKVVEQGDAIHPVVIECKHGGGK